MRMTVILRAFTRATVKTVVVLFSAKMSAKVTFTRVVQFKMLKMLPFICDVRHIYTDSPQMNQEE